MRRAVLCLSILIAFSAIAEPTTTNNDDNCDISALPAATLLLPYFEVDLSSRNGADTLFSVTNVTHLPRIARVTIWTDYAYPLFTFSLFLTGYDMQSISMFDVIANGVIAPPDGTTSESDVGRRSAANDENVLLDVSGCDDLAVDIPPAVVAAIRSALTTGRIDACATAKVGAAHDRAVGYLTIDVVNRCTATLPTDAGYFTQELLYDNVLIGDYQQVDRVNNFAQGGTMVHVRAVPEGGAPAARSTDLDRTFYSRYQAGGTADRRQPLPATFAARWISGGEGAFLTSYKIWREGVSGADAGCAVLVNRTSTIVETVRFDEEENPTMMLPDVILPEPPQSGIELPAASRVSAQDASVFPPNPGDDAAGWMYLNLDGTPAAEAAGQSWVIVSMAAEGRYSVDFDAVSLGNGCSPAAAVTDMDGDPPAIGPAPNVTSTETRSAPGTTNNDDSCDIALLPAATLLLPYFDVDLSAAGGETTLFTITNVSRLPQIARVTVWTDRSYPVVTFAIFLSGYDVQAISLSDLLGRGIIAPPHGTTSDSAHWISGGPGAFETTFKIWRDGVTGVGAGCNVQPNTANEYTEIVRFDEEENPTTFVIDCPFLCPEIILALPSTGIVNAADTSIFPANPGSDISGWMYLNLDNKKPVDGISATQGWVVTSMAAEGRFSVDFDAVALGNGCSPPAPMTAEDGTEPVIGPAPNDIGGF